MLPAVVHCPSKLDFFFFYQLPRHPGILLKEDNAVGTVAMNTDVFTAGEELLFFFNYNRHNKYFSDNAKGKTVYILKLPFLTKPAAKEGRQ